MQIETRFASIVETSRITGLSQGYIRTGCRNGTIPCILCGNRYKIDLHAYMRQLDQQSGSGEG